MAINVHELELFCEDWLRKAKFYQRQITGRPIDLPPFQTSMRQRVTQRRNEISNLRHSFDRFMSLYIVFNRVYLEVGKLLVALGQVRVSPSRRYAPLSDRITATSHVVDYYGGAALRNDMRDDGTCRAAIEALVELIRGHHFYLHEDYRTGSPDFDKDADLAKKARKYDPKAVLELIYQARCNLFHGEKAFEERQRILLDNMSIVLEFVTVRILAKLRADLKYER